MNTSSNRVDLTRVVLYAGIAVPFLYYGVQVLIASFNPGYSFISQAASELGSDRTRYAAVFNAIVMATGALTVGVAIAAFAGLRRLRVNVLLVIAACACLAVNGVQSLWAGWFPMPDPRHGGHPVFLGFMLLLPLFLMAATWKVASHRWHLAFISAIVLLLIMVPVMSGRVGDISAYRGLTQRIFTLSIFPPIGAACWIIARALGRAAGPATRV